MSGCILIHKISSQHTWWLQIFLHLSTRALMHICLKQDCPNFINLYEMIANISLTLKLINCGWIKQHRTYTQPCAIHNSLSRAMLGWTHHVTWTVWHSHSSPCKFEKQGFIQRGGLEFPPRNLEIEYGYYVSYLHVTENKYVSSKCCLEICPRLHQKQSERI